MSKYKVVVTSLLAPLKALKRSKSFFTRAGLVQVGLLTGLAVGLLVTLNISVVSAEKVRVTKGAASAGKTVKVFVKAGRKGFSTVGSSSFELGYDTTYLNATSVNSGGVLNNFTSYIDDAAGKVRAGSISLSGDNILGKATIFEVTFAVDDATPKGKIPISLISANLTDTNLPVPNPISTNVVGGVITIR